MGGVFQEVAGIPDDGTDKYTEASRGGRGYAEAQAGGQPYDICQLQAQYTKPCEGQEPDSISGLGNWETLEVTKRKQDLGKQMGL